MSDPTLLAARDSVTPDASARLTAISISQTEATERLVAVQSGLAEIGPQRAEWAVETRAGDRVRRFRTRGEFFGYLAQRALITLAAFALVGYLDPIGTFERIFLVALD